MDHGLLTLTELCTASGAKPVQVEFWCKRHVLVPALDSPGRGTPRRFGVINILEATQLVELTRAGFSSRQLYRLAEAQRARLASLPPRARLVEQYRLYIDTIVTLATTFGKGPTFDTWLKTQQAQLRKMERDLERSGDDGDVAVNARTVSLLGVSRARPTATLFAD